MKIDPYRITLLLSGYFSAYTQHEHEQYTFNHYCPVKVDK